LPLWRRMCARDRSGYEADERSSLGKAGRRCRWQMQAARFYRSGRKTRGSA